MYSEKAEQEYPQSEEPDQSDADEKSLGYSKEFILINTIEYILAKKEKVDLFEYLKKRILFATKYAKQILTEFMT